MIGRIVGPFGPLRRVVGVQTGRTHLWAAVQHSTFRDVGLLELAPMNSRTIPGCCNSSSMMIPRNLRQLEGGGGTERSMMITCAIVNKCDHG